ncbi:hypothetical protein ACOSQ3_005023 [Xanthoceras sorbifolium]
MLFRPCRVNNIQFLRRPLFLSILFDGIPKSFTNNSYFLVRKMCPRTIPNIMPLAYLIPTSFHPNANSDSDPSSSSSSFGGRSQSPHFLDKGCPHNLGFPSYDMLLNVSNCFPCGIGPVR